MWKMWDHVALSRWTTIKSKCCYKAWVCYMPGEVLGEVKYWNFFIVIVSLLNTGMKTRKRALVLNKFNTALMWFLKKIQLYGKSSNASLASKFWKIRWIKWIIGVYFSINWNKKHVYAFCSLFARTKLLTVFPSAAALRLLLRWSLVLHDPIIVCLMSSCVGTHLSELCKDTWVPYVTEVN